MLVYSFCVVPYAGTWIEIPVFSAIKLVNTVVPYAGTWIEIILPFTTEKFVSVVPYAGTWIEIARIIPMTGYSRSRSLRGNVD